MISKKRLAVVVVSVFLGFFCSFFIFGWLTNKKTSATKKIPPAPSVQGSSLPAQKVSSFASTAEHKAEVIKEESVLEQPLEQPKEVKEVILEETQAQDKDQEPPPEFPLLILKGIFYSGEGSLALINDSIVKEGDTILGVKVQRIHPTKVEMDLEGQRLILRTK